METPEDEDSSVARLVSSFRAGEGDLDRTTRALVHRARAGSVEAALHLARVANHVEPVPGADVLQVRAIAAHEFPPVLTRTGYFAPLALVLALGIGLVVRTRIAEGRRLQRDDVTDGATLLAEYARGIAGETGAEPSLAELVPRYAAAFNVTVRWLPALPPRERLEALAGLAASVERLAGAPAEARAQVARATLSSVPALAPYLDGEGAARRLVPPILEALHGSSPGRTDGAAWLGWYEEKTRSLAVGRGGG